MRDAPLITVLALPVVLAAACSGSPASPSSDRALSVRLETPHMVFHYSPGDVVEAERAEAFHEWAVRFLNVSCPKKVDYYKFKDRAQQYEVTQMAVTGWAVPAPAFQVWTYMPFMNHEQFHLYASLFGTPTTFFTEGIAVAYQVDPLSGDYEAREKSGVPIHDVARDFRRSGRLLPVSQIVDSTGFIRGDFTVTYVEAGSFVRHVADVHGIEKMKQVLRTIGYDDTVPTVSAKFQGIYGITLAEAERQWLAFIDGGR